MRLFIRPSLSFILHFLLFSFLFVSPRADALVAIYSGDAGTVNAEEVRQIFLGNRTAWADGTRVRAAILESDRLLTAFCESFLETTTDRFQALWRKKIFSGRAVPPRTVRSEDELVRFVKEQPRSIGVLENFRADSSLQKIELRPSTPIP